MDFPFQSCIISAGNSADLQVGMLLAYHPDMTYIVLDLQRFEDRVQALGGENIAARYLSSLEQEYFAGLTSEKRKREWLGGRFAAKYAAAELFVRKNIELPGSALAVIADENGRPFLAADSREMILPDISISHSGNLAAAMAVDKGYCGIDVQKITDRVIKIAQRFCSSDEKRIMDTFFHASRQKQSTLFTKLWAAKEAIRKVANLSSLPGFLELTLTEITAGSTDKASPFWHFVFLWKQEDMAGSPVAEKCDVTVSLLAEYVLALTARNDTLA